MFMLTFQLSGTRDSMPVNISINLRPPILFKVIIEDVDHHRPLYEDIHLRGLDMVTRSESAPERHQLELALADVDKRWKNLTSAIEESRNNLGRIVPAAVTYAEVREQVVTWLTENEKKFTELALTLGSVDDITVISQKQEQLRVTVCSSLCSYTLTSYFILPSVSPLVTFHSA